MNAEPELVRRQEKEGTILIPNGLHLFDFLDELSSGKIDKNSTEIGATFLEFMNTKRNSINVSPNQALAVEKAIKYEALYFGEENGLIDRTS